MREILFRAKRRDTKRWVNGSLLFYPDVNRAFMSLGEYKGGSFIEVFKDTIGQYTGLTDKNGTKIFEGDIVVTNIKGSNTVCKVAWADNVAQFQLWQFDTIPHTPTALNLGNYDCEVIGNIHDNPELLERSDNNAE